MQQPSETTQNQGVRVGRHWTVVPILALQTLLLLWSARVHSPVFDEPGYLVAGLSHWKYGRFDLYAANPPLLRTIATAPIHFFMQPKMDWTLYSRNPAHRPELALGRVFMQLNGKRAYDYFFVARVTAIPIALVGTILCYLLAKEIYDSWLAGISAAIFWAFSPESLGHGGLITPDMCSTVTALAETYVLWRFLRVPTVSWAVLLGCVTSLAMLSRSFWLALPVIQLVVVGLVWIFRSKVSGSVIEDGSRDGTSSEPTSTRDGVSLPHAMGMVLGSTLFALLPVNCFYGFQGTLVPLGQYTFVTWRGTGAPMPPMKRMSDVTDHRQAIVEQGQYATAHSKDATNRSKRLCRFESRFPGEFVLIPDPVPGNRFAGTLLGKLPVPLPRRYVEGIDQQWRDIEYGKVRTDWASYFGGRWKQGGWWYFYLVGLSFKTPLTLLAAVVLGIAAILIKRPPFHQMVGLICLLVPAMFILVIITASFGVHKHLRYTMPIIPLFAVLGGATALWCVSKSVEQAKVYRLASCGIAILLGLYVWESLSVAPHWLSYFNRLAGGPENGQKWFLDFNVDGGQDLPFVEEWLDKHPEARGSVKLAYFGSFSPADVGLVYDTPLPFERSSAKRNAESGPVTGWFIVSKNYVEGHPMPFRSQHSLQCFSFDQDAFGYFRAFDPVDRIGHSMLVYHLTAEDVNPVREALGLRPIGKAEEHGVTTETEH